MPSPLGHALAGVIAGWAVIGRSPHDPAVADAKPLGKPTQGRLAMARLAHIDLTHADWLPFALMGMLPDVDLLAGAHSTYTHSVGAALLAMGVAAIVARQRARASWRKAAIIGCAIGAAYGSHILLDWLGTDTAPPRGI